MGDDLESMGKLDMMAHITYEAESGGLLEPIVRQSWQDRDTPFRFTF